jgi:hypothetical protein
MFSQPSKVKKSRNYPIQKSATRENTSPPLENAFGRNKTPVPTNAFTSIKNAFDSDVPLTCTFVGVRGINGEDSFACSLSKK